jgi:hypothetical protein
MGTWKRIGKAYLTLGLDESTRADLKRLATAARSGEGSGETLALVRAEAQAIHAEGAERDRLERPAKEFARSVRLTAEGTYLGATRRHDGLRPGSSCGVRLDADGIAILSAVRRTERLRIAWAEIVDIDVTDNSRTEIKTRVEQRASGGIWSLPGTTAPVGRTSSRHVALARVGIETADGALLLMLRTDPAALDGKLMLTRDRWVRQTGPEGPAGSVAQRLALLDELHAAGHISEDERRDKRAEILAEL